MFSKSTCSLWWRWRSFPALNNLVNIWFSFIYIYKKKKNIAKKGKFEPLFSHKRVKAPLICPPPPEYVSIQFNQFLWSSHTLGTSLVAQTVKCLLTMGRPGFNPWVGKISWRRKWQPTPVFLPGKSHGQRNLVGYSPWGCKESDTTERLHFHFHHTFDKRVSSNQMKKKAS